MTTLSNKNFNDSLALSNDNPVTICLNMIVRNESKIIRRLLDSVLPIIDSYCICDTGSEDNTIEIIKSYFENKTISGRIFEHPFKNFGYNRTYSFKEAQKLDATYILVLDADMVLQIGEDFNKQSLDKGAYTVKQGDGALSYYNPRLIRSDIQTVVRGPTHEYYDLPSNIMKCKLDSLSIYDINDGGHKQNKFKRDIKLLLGGLEEEPNNDRYHFYLANTYHDTKEYEKAIKYYTKRIEMGGWYEELWYSYFRIGLCHMKLGCFEKALSTWLDSYEYYPKRAESIYEIVKYYRINGKHLLAYHFYKMAKSIKFPKNDILFVHTNVYNYLLDYELSLLLFYIRKKVNKVPEIQPIFMHLMNQLPCTLFYNMISNLKFYVSPLTARRQTKMSFSTEKVIDDKKFISSNISLCPLEEGYLLNIQYNSVQNNNNNNNNNNKNKNKNKKKSHQQLEIIHERIYLDEDFMIINSNIVDRSVIDTKQQTNTLLENINVLLFDNTIYYSTYQVVLHNKKIQVKPCFGVYSNENKSDNLETKKLLEIRTVNSEVPSTNLKKYVLFKSNNRLHFVYSWYPLLIGVVDNAKNKNPTFEYDEKESGLSISKKYQNNQKHIHINTINDIKKTPSIFKLIENTTNGFTYENEIWFVADFMSVEGAHTHKQQKLQNYHFFIVLDRENHILLRYSYPFTIENNKIERCSGIVVEKKQIIISYSSNETDSSIICYDRFTIMNKIYWDEF